MNDTTLVFFHPPPFSILLSVPHPRFVRHDHQGPSSTSTTKGHRRQAAATVGNLLQHGEGGRREGPMLPIAGDANPAWGTHRSRVALPPAEETCAAAACTGKYEQL